MFWPSYIRFVSDRKKTVDFLYKAQHTSSRPTSGFRAPLDDLTLIVTGRVIEQPSGVPAPASLALLLGGLVAAAGLRARRRGR